MYKKTFYFNSLSTLPISVLAAEINFNVYITRIKFQGTVFLLTFTNIPDDETFKCIYLLKKTKTYPRKFLYLIKYGKLVIPCVSREW